ncbi:MAG: hypothetical protein J6R52_03850 [Alphaproteobacteria bacterium]|nr:hypothetical protein [Alphaproteobacteria bacterium]
MRTKKANGIYNMTINGRPEVLCIDGDGWQQIDTFHKIEHYMKTHQATFKYATIPANKNTRQQDILSVKSDKYEIVAFRVATPGATNLLFTPQYRVQVYDSKTKEANTYMGTVAGFMFDMLNNFRGQQK